MKKAFVCAITSIIVLLQVSPAGGVPAETPEAFVRRFYKDYLGTFEKSYWFDKEKILSRYFDNNLTALFLKDEQCKKRGQGICNLDFDPIIDAQDYDNNIYSTLKVEKEGVAALPSVKVTFINLGTTTVLKYALKQTDNGWRINNIVYPHDDSLVKILSRK